MNRPLTKPSMAIVSHVLPFPSKGGQQQRVRNKLIALAEYFHITFITKARLNETDNIQKQLLEFCDNAMVLPSRYARSLPVRLWHLICGFVFGFKSGLKSSNYIIGQVEFPPSRLATCLNDKHFDVVLFEYWHATAATAVFRAAGIPCVLDMHDILWQSYQGQLAAQRLPQWWRERQVRSYRQQEEASWGQFDALITINAAEHAYVQERLPDKPLFYTPMGIDLEQWPFSWQPAAPPRVAYYGGLGSPHNQYDALRCYEKIMPIVWQDFPDVELWLVGSNPPDILQSLPEKDGRVHVTGFVEDVQDVLRTMSLVLCPWIGRYGFRSRLVEVMALGVSVVTTPDAIYGMNLKEGMGVLLAETDIGLADHVVSILQDNDLSRQQSQRARQQIEQQYSFKHTYERLACELKEWLAKHHETIRFLP